MKPAVFQGLFCFLRHIEISLHHAAAADLDLAVLNAYIGVRDRPADGAFFMMVRRLAADNKRTLRHAVPFKDIHAVFRQLIDIVRIEMRASGENDL